LLVLVIPTASAHCYSDSTDKLADLERRLVSNHIQPLLDSGDITDSIAPLGSRNWLFDTGIEIKFRLLTVGVTFTYGKDLRSGRNAFYFTAR